MTLFEKEEFQSTLNAVASGWNTWDTRSMLNHVLLPQGFALDLGFCLYGKCQVYKDAHSGRSNLGPVQGTSFQTVGDHEANCVEVKPGLHAYDGSYTALRVNIRGILYDVESAHVGEDLVLLVTPHDREIKPPVLFVQGKLMWNRPGTLSLNENSMSCRFADSSEVSVHGTKPVVPDPNLPASYPYLTYELDSPVGISTGRIRSLDEIQKIVAREREKEEARHIAYGELSEMHKGVQVAQAWNIIYEPKYERVICPVARSWNIKRLGYVLFCWDSFFTARLVSVDNKEFAYLIALETFREMVDDAFVPNCTQGSGRRSWDRSQPPVGSTSIWAIYEKWGDRWLLEASWEPLLKWNRWWDSKRRNALGLISGGSHPFDPKIGDPAETIQPNTRLGAALESAADNGHLYDDIPFDVETHQLKLADVCMSSFYIRDCQDLRRIAVELGRTEEAQELQGRIESYSAGLSQLWHSESGTFLNKRTDSGEFDPRVAATNLYPMLAGVATQEQAERMVKELLLNPEEFGGEWLIPLSPRSDPSFKDQLYWRGRIWPPVNFLVYLGLRNYQLDDARKALVESSKKMFLGEWEKNGSVWENYCPLEGIGGNSPNSHPLYTWGALLGLICLIEEGAAVG